MSVKYAVILSLDDPVSALIKTISFIMSFISLRTSRFNSFESFILCSTIFKTAATICLVKGNMPFESTQIL
ncbi:hypothetical protein A0H76_1352 [Hepatospora eriocheir]|uniref:Uncharacterized protein n=1 Tax=Hepatospora eriocheir TaxID=1081669 RepID=A0A1X0QH78_9MICR|nr:hypothetical protein A0H76_1352 [Hepatospora eriocheir]